MSIIVFWLEPTGESAHQAFGKDDLVASLQFIETKRRAGMRHVCISSEHSDSVGPPGVTAVENGRLPDGHEYDWSKAHRGAGPVKP